MNRTRKWLRDLLSFHPVVAQIICATVFFSTFPKEGYCRESPTVTIVTATGSRKVPVMLSMTPEQWNMGPSKLVGAGEKDAAVLLKLSSSRLLGISARNTPFPVDAVVFDTQGQVLNVYENVRGSKYHAHHGPVIGVIYYKAGFVEEVGIVKGNLIIAGGFSLKATGAPSNDEASISKNRESILTKLIASAKQNPDIWTEVGRIYAETGEPDKAIDSYKKAVSANPSARNLASLAIALAATGKVDESVGTLTKAIDADSSYVDAYLKLAALSKMAKKIESFVLLAQKGLEKHPGLSELRVELAKTYLHLNQTHLALSVLKNAPKTIAKDAASISRVLGDVYLRQGKMHEAALEYENYLKEHKSAPHSAELRLFIARHRAELSAP